MARTNHAVLIDMNTVVEGENTLMCTECGQSLILLYTSGQGFSLRDADANNPAFGDVAISYVPAA